MRHRKSRYQLNRFTSWRRATLVSLIKNLLKYQSIKTTVTKAKAVKPFVDRIISLAKENSLTARRQAYKTLGDHRLVVLLFGELGPRFIHRSSGYTRILKAEIRRGDSAQMAILELTEIKKKKPAPPKKEKETKPKESQEEKPFVGRQEEKPAEEKKPKTEVLVKEKPPISKKPSKNFLGGLRKIFKRERDAL